MQAPFTKGTEAAPLSFSQPLTNPYKASRALIKLRENNICSLDLPPSQTPSDPGPRVLGSSISIEINFSMRTAEGC